MNKIVRDIAGFLLVVGGVGALLLKVEAWPCIATIGIGALLIDPADILTLLSTALPSLQKYLPGGPK